MGWCSCPCHAPASSSCTSSFIPSSTSLPESSLQVSSPGIVLSDGLKPGLIRSIKAEYYCPLGLAIKARMAEMIRSSEKASLVYPSRIICHVCQKQFSQYTCPRCNLRYCSLPCYKSHSLRCTESFMRENVVGEMQQLHPDDETKKKMLAILTRFHSEEGVDTMDDDENESTLSEETIQKILSGDEISFDDLSVEEKKRFQRAVASGELSRMIKFWDPWWLKPAARTICLSKEGTQLIQPIEKHETPSESKDDLGSTQSSEIPSGPECPLPPLHKLTPTEPSPLLAIHLVDIIYSYCFTLRLYNGDWQSDAIGSAMVVLGVSSVLGQSGQPETVREALSYCLEETCSPAFRHAGGLQFGMALVEDVVSLLLLGGSAIICMLCDLQRLIQAGERELKSEKTKRLRKGDTRNKLKLAERKAYFIMCWVHVQPEEAWSSLAAIVRAEKSSFMDHGDGRSFLKVEKRPENKSRVLIEEM